VRDAKQLVVELHEFHFSVTTAGLGYRAELLEQAIALIESQAAEIERLTPKPMTVERAVDVLNEQEQSQVRYELVGSNVFSFLGRNQLSLEPLTKFVAIAVAEKLEREQEAARG
jgi:hypothetical protein